MAWENPMGVQELINSYKALQLLGIKLPFGQRGGSAKPKQQPVQPGSKKWSAQTCSGWTCPGCHTTTLGFVLLFRMQSPTDQEQPAADLEMVTPEAEASAERVFKVGDHLCVIINSGTCMACRHCQRYVTSYKGTWRNLGTLRKQPCKPKKPKRGKAGKAPQKQKGGALPALPPGSLTRSKQKKVCKKPRLMPVGGPLHETLDSLREQVERDFGAAEASAGDQTPSTSAGQLSAQPLRRDAEASEVTLGAPVRTSRDRRGIRPVPHDAQIDRELPVCLQCLPVVVYDAVTVYRHFVPSLWPGLWQLLLCAACAHKNYSRPNCHLQQCRFQLAVTRNVGMFAPLHGGMPKRGRKTERSQRSVAGGIQGNFPTRPTTPVFESNSPDWTQVPPLRAHSLHHQ
eukprot:535052-Amphidinium_carterae.1